MSRGEVYEHLLKDAEYVLNSRNLLLMYQIYGRTEMLQGGAE